MRPTTFFLSLAVVAGLAACSSGDRMSFTNSDSFLESYRNVTADMNEAERQAFRRNLFLVGFDNTSAADAGSTLSDVQQAWEYERTTLDLRGEGATPLASQFALRGSDLDGLTVADINTLGEARTDAAIRAEIANIERQRKEVRTAQDQLEADKATWRERHDAALEEEARLIAEGQAYGMSVSDLRIEKSYSGPNLRGRYDVTGKPGDPATRVRARYLVEHDGHTARITEPILMNRMRDQTLPINLGLSPRAFVDADGTPLADDYDLPLDIDAYDVTAAPQAIVTQNGEIDFALASQLQTALLNLPAKLADCDRNLETTGAYLDALDTREATLRDRAFGELRNISVRYAGSCA